jgi:nucleoside-diphosphate-sugar epimerase
LALDSVLITGGSGFIGSHLIDRYLGLGAHVIGVDNHLTGTPRNVRHLEANARFHLIESDVSDDWGSIFAQLRVRKIVPQLVLHFASPASPVDYAAHPLETMAVNSIGTRRALDAAKEWGARFLFASTSECYGDPLEHPQRESYWGNVNSFGPRACYDESKRFGEALTYSYTQRYGSDTRVIRIFNTYGPRMRLADGRVVPNFISQALEGKPLTVFGDGRQTRSFCYVDDLVEGIVRCAESKRTRGLVVNLGNPEEYEIATFARIVCEAVGVSCTTVASPLPVDDPGRRCPDITRARELLGWEPKVSLTEGLRRTIEYFRDSLTATTP